MWNLGRRPILPLTTLGEASPDCLVLVLALNVNGYRELGLSVSSRSSSMRICRNDTISIDTASIVHSQIFLYSRLCTGNQVSVICRFANHSLCVHQQTLSALLAISPSDFICGSLIVYYIAVASA